MSGRRQEAQERAARVAALRAAQQRKERRTRLLIVAGVVLVVAILAGAVAWVISGEMRRQADLQTAADQPIAGVEEQTGLSQEHVPDLPDPTAEPGGTLLPPMGGAHDPVWQNCGVYMEPVRVANAVHSLEHGAVWITYRPDLPAEELEKLRELVEGESFTLLSPFEDLASPIVLTAWGVQLQIDDADDPRAPVFLEKYVQGPQTPEPGAACTGGVGSPS